MAFITDQQGSAALNKHPYLQKHLPSPWSRWPRLPRVTCRVNDPQIKDLKFIHSSPLHCTILTKSNKHCHCSIETQCCKRGQSSGGSGQCIFCKKGSAGGDKISWESIDQYLVQWPLLYLPLKNTVHITPCAMWPHRAPQWLGDS